LKKEKLKTIILILLIANSLFLTNQIWFSKELWSHDYNFFVKWRDWKWVKVLSKININDESNPITMEHFFYPRKVVVNNGNYRNVYSHGDNRFFELNNEISSIFNTLLKGEKVKSEQSTDEEWLNTLKGKSFYIDYGVKINAKILARMAGYKDSSVLSQIDSVRDFIVAPGDMITNDIVLYIKDSERNSVIKFFMNYDKSKLTGIIEEFVSNSKPNYTFSFEQKFDKVNPDKKVEQKAILDPEILIPVKIEASQDIRIKSINTLNMNKIDKILKSFQYNPNTTRKYIEADNTIVYVENYSMLKIHPSGLIEYTETDEGKGMLLLPESADDTQAVPTVLPSEGGSNTLSLYESFSRVIAHINKVWDNNEFLFISSDIVENANKPGVYRFTFDYYYNGMPVIIQCDNENGQQDVLRHAIEVEIINGRLKSYRHYLRNFEEVSRAEKEIMPVILALDNIYKSFKPDQSEVKIDDVFLGFWENDTDVILQPRWGIRIGDRVITDPEDIK